MDIAPHKRILCALDTTDQEQALSLARDLSPYVGGVKLGLEFFCAHGPDGFARIADCGMPIFLDLKLHDIPNTIAKAIKSLSPLQPFMMTIHAGGGPAMMKAAIDAAQEATDKANLKRAMVVGVTVLTSMDQTDLDAIGIHRPPAQQVEILARAAQEAGLDGVVCSSHEITRLRKACDNDFRLIVPGIRPKGSDKGDQKRIKTPAEAVKLGADYLVIGRPITMAADPVAAAQRIATELTL
ncbi:MAG: orotidine-5'-phosphate decarboxylase [Kordiimonas sp.]|nr:orotidine-5'-phosphate decarboxylase [Kordiimonas sp.]